MDSDVNGEISNRRPRVYLAGPDVFFPGSGEIFRGLKAICDRLGMVGVEPSDGGLEEGFVGSDDERARSIYEGIRRDLPDA